MKNRYNRIMEICKDGTVSVEELAQIFKVSQSTIRRDLTEMEEKGMIVRVHGGAKINDDQIVEPNMSYKEISMSEEKANIGRYAASLIHPGDIVYIDAGTTTSKIIDYITYKDVLIVTTGINCIEKCIERNLKCQCFGGYTRARTNVLISSEAIEKARNSMFHIAFVAANGVHPFTGFTCSDEMESGMKSVVLKQAIKSYICMDSSKINKLNNIKIADAADSVLITDKLVDGFDYSIFRQTISVTSEGISYFKKGEQ